MIGKEELNAALSRFEAKELGLLTWGLTHGTLTEEEALKAIQEIQAERAFQAGPHEVLTALLDQRLVFRLPSDPSLLRSRFAETIRLLSTLRQTFRNQTSTDGRPLTLDFRVKTKPRSRPRWDVPKSEALTPFSGPGHQTASSLAPPTVSAFQARAFKDVGGHKGVGRRSGVVIAAGTGSGKTLAFYLPALVQVGEAIRHDQAPSTKVLGIYPRKELLKDQIQGALEQITRLNQDLPRPISVGAWFGDTPLATSPRWLSNWQKTAGGVRCPYLVCPEPDCGEPLTWRDSDVRAGHDRLHCGNGHVLDDSRIRLTRDAIKERPPDLMFTTTESLNRQMGDPTSHQAFGLHTKPGLMFVLLDEIHVYEGLLGSQTAYLMRRLSDAVWGRPLFVGLSATLANPGEFFSQLTGIYEDRISIVQPTPDEMEELGSEYFIAIRHDPSHYTSPVSLAIQANMLLGRTLDNRERPASGGLFGSRLFFFGDRLDTVNRLLWDTRDAEGLVGRADRCSQFVNQTPRTLAHLRSERQMDLAPALQEAGIARDSHGQWWWMPEQIGHDLDDDQSLCVSRTTSQDSGVSNSSDVVIATASLEVGVDDESVGAVVQYRAPRDLAQFVQRRGRAGRDVHMRPWTVLLLSDWGGDKAAWEDLDRYVDPNLDPLHLPLSNRYVQRIQATYATLDWLATLARERSDWGGFNVWTAMAQPPHVRGDNTRYEREAQLLLELLRDVERGGVLEGAHKTHIARTLGLDAEEMQDVNWGSPRSLLLATIPTAVRRLATAWRGEEVAERQFDRTPLPEFMPGAMFNSLLTPDVEIRYPSGSQAELVSESLDIGQALREIMPGNVSRRFSVRSDLDRHWVPIAESDQLDVNSVYDVEETGQVAFLGSGVITLYRPRAVTLTVPPREVSDSTTAMPEWVSRLDPVGEARSLGIPTSRFSRLVTDWKAFTSSEGTAVRVTRAVVAASGRILRTGQDPVEFRTAFVDSGTDAPQALGYEMEVDALLIEVRGPDELPPPSPLERLDRLRFLIENEASSLTIPGNRFQRKNITSILLLVLSRTGDDFTSLSTEAAKAELHHACLQLAGNFVHIDEPDHGAIVPVGDATDDLLRILALDETVDQLRSAVKATLGPRDTEWTNWSQERVASTVGLLALEATRAVCPEVDPNSLSLDVEDRGNDGFGVWISETAPGGVGYIDLISRTVTQRPWVFLNLLELASEPQQLARLDEEIRAVLETHRSSDTVAQATSTLRESWSQGNLAAKKAFESWRLALLDAGLEVPRQVVSLVANRFVSPGAHHDLPDVVLDLLDQWQGVEARLGIALPTEVAAAVGVDADLAGEALRVSSGDGWERRLRAVEGMIWPRSETARGLDLHQFRYRQVGGAERSMVAACLAAVPDPVDLVSEGASDKARTLLQETGRVDVVAADASLVSAFLLLLEADPVEMGPLRVAPFVASVSRAAGRVRVRLLLEEKF